MKTGLRAFAITATLLAASFYTKAQTIYDLGSGQESAGALYNVEATPSILMYPNPVIAQTRIVLPDPAINVVHVDVIDLNGRLLISSAYAPGTQLLDVDMSMLAQGLYAVRIREKGKAMQYIKAMKEQ